MGVPFSWHNMDWGTQLRRIGWDFEFTFGAVSIPSAKLDSLLNFLTSIMQSPKSHDRKVF